MWYSGSMHLSWDAFAVSWELGGGDGGGGGGNSGAGKGHREGRGGGSGTNGGEDRWDSGRYSYGNSSGGIDQGATSRWHRLITSHHPPAWPQHQTLPHPQHHQAPPQPPVQWPRPTAPGLPAPAARIPNPSTFSSTPAPHPSYRLRSTTGAVAVLAAVGSGHRLLRQVDVGRSLDVGVEVLGNLSRGLEEKSLPVPQQ